MRTKMFMKQNVFDAALDRIRYLYDEFDDVVVSFSGGKDSTVCLHLALQVAEEKDRLPVPVLFIDQEAEWSQAIRYIRTVMDRPDVQPWWLQVPIRLFNATSPADQWLHCWGPGEDWMREQEADTLKENVYGTEAFQEIFDAFYAYHYKGRSVASLTGMRCEESPIRLPALTHGNVYKGITWGKRVNGMKEDHYSFSPIYDWFFSDVWKAIHDNNWSYCELYDLQYQHGIPLREMRVSSVHHETALKSLDYLQEADPETWNALTARLSGINTHKQMDKGWYVPKELPFMFSSWREYRDHLVDKLMTDPTERAQMVKLLRTGEEEFLPLFHEDLCRFQCTLVVKNDYHGRNWRKWAINHRKWSRKFYEDNSD